MSLKFQTFNVFSYIKKTLKFINLSLLSNLIQNDNFRYPFQVSKPAKIENFNPLQQQNRYTFIIFLQGG